MVGANGAGIICRLLMGRAVVFAPGPNLPGTWAEYAIAPAAQCVPLPSKLKPEEGVNLLANAMTAVALVEETAKARSPALVLTAAAGELGRMVNAVAAERGIGVVDVVRRMAQAEGLRARDARHVVATDDPGAADILRAAVAETGATIAADGVSGETARLLLDVLPDGGELISFGRLSGEPVSFNPMHYLIGKHLTVRGFDVGAWLGGRGKAAQLMAVRRAGDVLVNGPRTVVAHAVGLTDLAERFDALAADQTDGKTILFPNGRPR